MTRLNILILALLVAAAGFAQSDPVAARIDRIVHDVPLVDGHNDLPWEYRQRANDHLAQIDIAQDQSKITPPLHTDIARLRQGRLGAQFWSVYVPTTLKGADAVRATLEQIDVVNRLDARYPETFELARTADDVMRIHRAGKIASLIGVEGGHSIGDSLAVLRDFYALGARYMTITHSDNNDFADSATDTPAHNGLTPFGRQVIAEMNRLGMLVDLSHVSPKTMNDVLDIAAAPVIFSHSSARAVTNHARNVPDDVLRRLKDNDGVVMVSFVPTFDSEKARQHDAAKEAEDARLKALYKGQPDAVKTKLAEWVVANPAPRATVADVADHIDHIVQVAGPAHAGIGSDFDGITSTPEGLDSVATYPKVFAELIRRGYTDDQLKGIAGLNVLRVMRKAEEVAARLQKERAPSDVRIEEVDAPTSSGSGSPGSGLR
ncbi:MAG TPA: dipeptidase [Thermoanaerobaculia bacterium]|nr:dipeptidase [Thermoanaerobaculia bacterium]